MFDIDQNLENKNVVIIHKKTTENELSSVLNFN